MYLYLRTKEGLGQDKETWIAPQAPNRVMVEPVPIGYLGNFYEHLGSPAEQTCYTVANFGPNSWGLPVDLQKKIQKIADDIVGKVKRKLHRLRIKRRKKAIVRLLLDIRAHLDVKTDTARSMWFEGRKGGPLYWRRGTVVWEDLKARLDEGLKKLKDRYMFSSFIDYNSEPQGTAHPVSSTNPDENRRVEVCIRSLVVKKESASLHKKSGSVH